MWRGFASPQKTGSLFSRITLVSLFIRAPDFSPLKPLRSVTRFLCLGRARIIHDTNSNSDQGQFLDTSPQAWLADCQEITSRFR